MPDKFTYVKRGYDPSEVDNYVDSLENVIKSYKEKDAAIKNAIINAQIAADNIVKNAEIEAKQLKKDTIIQLETIFNSISTQKNLLKDFQNDYNAMVSKYLQEFNEKDLFAVYERVNSLEEYLTSLNDTINQDLNKHTN